MSGKSPSASDGRVATDRARLQADVAARRADLAGTSRASAPQTWAYLQLRLGDALLELAHTYRPEHWIELQDLRPQAEQAFEAALAEPEHLAPLDQAAARMQLGHLLSLRLGGDRSRGIELCREAVDGIRREDAPELWGTAQHRLADAL